MKKLAILILCMFPILMQGQTNLPIDSITGTIVFRTIVEFDSTYTSDKIYSITKEWFSVNLKEFNRSSSDKNFDTFSLITGSQKGNSTSIDQLHKIDPVLKSENLEQRKLIGKGVLKYTGGNLGCIRVIYIDYDIKVFIKDFKAKIEITNLAYTHYNQVSFKQSQMYGFDDNGLCGSKNTFENLLQCEHCKGEFTKMYTYISSDMAKISNDFKAYLTTNNKDIEKW